MLRIRREQMAELARSHVGNFLAKDLSKAGAQASYEPATGEVLVSAISGQTARLMLDEEGRVAKVRTPLGRTYEYNFTGKSLASVGLPNGLKLNFLNDEQDRPVVIQRGANYRYECSYDAAGQLEEIRFPDRTSLRMEYTEKKHLRTLRDRLGQTLRYEYDHAENLVAIVDPKGGETKFQYGNWDKPDQTTYADGTKEAYQYTPSGFIEKIDCDGQSVCECSHDDSGRLTGIRYADGHFISFTYNEGGQVIEAKNPAITVRCEYDAEGRLVSEDQAGEVVRYVYDQAGQLQALVLPDGVRIKYGYDADGRLTQIRNWNDGLYQFEYDAGDQPHRMILPNGLQEKYLFDEASQFLGIRVSDDLHDRWRQVYKRDLSDRIVQLVDSRYGTLTYQYDAEGRLLHAGNEDTKFSESFAYDVNSNRAEHNGVRTVFDSLNRPVQNTNKSYKYDASGNRILESGPKGTTKYWYNGQNLLTKIQRPDGSILEFAYDAFARRIRKTVGRVTTSYLWAGHQMISEVTEVEGHQERRDYLFWPLTYKPLAMRVNGIIYHYHNDHLGTPQILTDNSGKIVWSARYEAFGRAQIKTETIKNPLRFPGQYYDSETGHHYNRARYYDPDTASYLSRDPASFLTGFNLYSYGDGDPIHGSDPLGLWGESWPGWLKTTVSIAGAVVAGVAIGALAVALAPVALSAAVIAGIGIAAGGMAAGAAGFGLNAAMTEGACVPCEMLRGLGVGALASLPFVAVPFAGVAAMFGLGALSGMIGYTADWAGNTEPWSTETFLLSVAIGTVTAGLGRFVFGKYAKWKSKSPATKVSPRAKYGSASDEHIKTHGHAPDGRPPTIDPRATQRAGAPRYKSKFAPGEGGQNFTDEVMTHPKVNTTVQGNGRTVHSVDDLGRVTGTGQNLEPVRGGTVVVESATPHANSTTPPGEVVTQFPSGTAESAPGSKATGL